MTKVAVERAVLVESEQHYKLVMGRGAITFEGMTHWPNAFHRLVARWLLGHEWSKM